MHKHSLDQKSSVENSPRQLENKPIVFAGMAKDNKPQISKRGFNSRRDLVSKRSSTNKNEQIYDEIVKQFDIYEFLDINEKAAGKGPQDMPNNKTDNGYSKDDSPFSEQLEFDLDEQDIE